jgi:head-tail adaptor
VAVYDGEAARAGYRVEIRMRADVRSGWRIAWGERALRIVSTINPDAGDAVLILNCEEETL